MSGDGDNAAGPALEVRDLTVIGPRGRKLITVPQLSAAPGETLVIRGPSGAGKSTLLFALAGLQAKTNGQVRWDGTDILALSASARAGFRRRMLGIVFQDFNLFEELGPLDNAALPALFEPRPSGQRERASTLLARLGVPATTRDVATLSGGERQRVSIARALAGNPGAILADEPTAALDRRAADALILDLTEMARAERRTLVAVSHDPAFHEAADRVVSMQDGHLGDA